MPVRCLAALLAAPLIVAALSGCGSADELSSAAVARAADATVAKGGVQLAIASTVTVPGAGRMTLVGAGTIDPSRQIGRLQTRLKSAGGLPASVSNEDLTQEMILDHLTIYVRSPLFAAGLPAGKRWIKLDIAKLGEAAGLDLSSLTQAGQDPTQALRLLRAVSGDIKKVGEEDVRGVATTHYGATVDLRKYPDSVPARERAAVRRSTDRLIELTGTSTIPVEVWVDGDDLVRRYRQQLSIKAGAATTRGQVQYELYGFGAQVDATVPPAREVLDISELAASGRSGGGRTTRTP